MRFLILMTPVLLYALVLPASVRAQTELIRAHQSQVVIENGPDSSLISGVLVDAATGHPVREAITRVGERGMLSDDDGWFRFHVPQSNDGPLVIEKIGFVKLELSLSDLDRFESVYFRTRAFEYCDFVVAPGQVVPQSRRPGLFTLILRDLTTGTRMATPVEVSVVWFDEGTEPLTLEGDAEAQMIFNLSGPGAFELRMSAHGYADAVSGPWLAPTDPCAANGVDDVTHLEWLLPTP